jgi:Flp pilus assembly protein TadD/ketosteroid isomerase-like protein
MVISRFSLALFFALLAGPLPAVALASVPSIQDVNLAFRQGNNLAALEKVNSFLATNPKDAQGRFLKGLILTELNRQPEAIKVFSDLTDDYPELPEPYNNLAVLYAAQGQYERAKNSLEMAIRTHPSYATAHENLGDIYAKMASQSYDKALQLDKSNTSALTKLAMIRDLFSPTHMQDAGKGKSPTKSAKSSHLAQQTTAPVETVRPATPPPAPVEEAAKPADAPPVEAPAQAEKPAEPPVTKKPATPPVAPKVAIEHALKGWAEAWSKRDADAYLSFYGEDFKVPGGRARADWETERRDRVTRPKFIKVEVDRIHITLDGDHAKVGFNQRYSSNIVRKSHGYKTLEMARQGDAWKIVGER